MAHGIVLSVSVLNVLLNLFVVFLVAVGAEIAQYGIYKSTQLQLKRRGTAPFVTEPDDIFSHFKNRLSGARKSHSVVNFVFVLVSASLIFGEICSEVGVDASQRCEPRRLVTMGLCAEPFDHLVSDSRIVASAYHTRMAAWDNREIRNFPVYEGFRKNFNGRESFSHPPTNKSKDIVVGECDSSEPVKIEPYDATLTISNSNNVWKTYISNLITPNGTVPLKGFGDLTHNGKTVSAFLIVPSANASVQARAKILEYHSKNQLQKVMMEAYKNKTRRDMTIRNEEYMTSYSIWCRQFPQSTEKFARALQVYRSVQLEDSGYDRQNISISGKFDETIPPMNSSDAVRAAITLALLNGKDCAGETWEYSECGIYHWEFLAPLLILFAFVVIFAVSNGLMVMFEKADVELPHSSSAWSAVALQYIAKNQEGKFSLEKGSIEERSNSSMEVDISDRGYYQLNEGKDGRKEVVFRFKGQEQGTEKDESQEESNKTKNSEAGP